MWGRVGVCVYSIQLNTLLSTPGTSFIQNRTNKSLSMKIVLYDCL